MIPSRLALVVGACALAAAVGAGEAKPKRPKLDLRATPRMAFSPVNVLLTAELVGGEDVEEYHCPELEWEWGDGGKSVHESDCRPWQPGTTIERRFTAEHEFRRAGVYTVKVTMRRAEKILTTANVKVTVRPGLGNPTVESGSSFDGR